MMAGRISWLRLGDIGDERLAILREEANQWLITRADDLPAAIEDTSRSKREVEEVAALGRLVSGLRRGEILIPDPIVRELVARETSEATEFERIKEKYDRLLAEHESWSALLTHIESPPPEAVAGGEEEDRDAEPGLLVEDDDDPVTPAPEHSVEIDLAGRLSDDQLRIVRGAVTGTLASRAGDLRLLHTRQDPDREVSEVAALARLAFWLERGEIQVPDRVVQEVAAKLAAGVAEMNEFDEIRVSHEEAVAEEEALGVLLAIFSEQSPPDGGE